MTKEQHSTSPVIVQILPALNFGGVERGTLEIAEAVIAKGWRAVVISSGGLLVPQLERMGAVHHQLAVDQKTRCIGLSCAAVCAPCCWLSKPLLSMCAHGCQPGWPLGWQNR